MALRTRSMCEFCYARIVVATGTRTSAASERRIIHTRLRLPHCYVAELVRAGGVEPLSTWP